MSDPSFDHEIPRRQCSHEGCKAPPMIDRPTCYFHDEDLKEQRRESCREGGKRGWLHWRQRRKAAHEARLRKAAASERKRIIEELSREAAKPNERPFTQHPSDCACCHGKLPAAKPSIMLSPEDIEKLRVEQKQREAALQRELLAESMRSELVRRYITPQPRELVPQPTPPCGIAGVDV